MSPRPTSRSSSRGLLESSTELELSLRSRTAEARQHPDLARWTKRALEDVPDSRSLRGSTGSSSGEAGAAGSDSTPPDDEGGYSIGRASSTSPQRGGSSLLLAVAVGAVLRAPKKTRTSRYLRAA